MRKKKGGCLLPTIIMAALILVSVISYFVQQPKGPEVPFDASVPNNHLVYFDAVSVTPVRKHTVNSTKTTPTRTTYSTNSTITCRCTTVDGETVWLSVEEKDYVKHFGSTLLFGIQEIPPINVRGKRIHGVKLEVSSGATAEYDVFVRFKDLTPVE